MRVSAGISSCFNPFDSPEELIDADPESLRLDAFWIPARDDTRLVSSDGSMTMMPSDYTGVVGCDIPSSGRSDRNSPLIPKLIINDVFLSCL